MQKWIVLDIIWLVTALLSVSLYLIIEKQVDVSLEWPIIHLFKQDAMLWLNYRLS